MARKSLTELREEMRAVARGERKASSLPATVSELVELTGRAQPNISRSLQLLARYRLIQLVREGREVRVEPIARAVRVDLATGTYETGAAA
jgi:predicted transcriptional regulator